MVVPTPSPIAEQELRTTDGQVYAYIVPATELERLRSEMEALRSKVAQVERERDRYLAELTEVLKTYIPIPPSEEELKAAVPNSEELARLISDLEAR
jgi:hypothetical protein